MDIGAEGGGVGGQDPWDMGLEHRRCQNITVKILAMDDIGKSNLSAVNSGESMSQYSPYCWIRRVASAHMIYSRELLTPNLTAVGALPTHFSKTYISKSP
jgi:hypothetical protein